MLDEGHNPYESDSDYGVTYARRIPTSRKPVQQQAPAATRDALPSDFDFAAAMFNDANAWREMARVIASDAA